MGEASINDRLLIIDDDQLICEVFQDFLRRGGFSVEIAASGEEGIARFHDSPFDVVVTDKNLPGLSGLDVLNQIKQMSPITEVIVMTGHASLESAIQAMELGAYDYLLKPLEMKDARKKIERALEKQRLSRQTTSLVRELDAARNFLENIIRDLSSGLIVTDPRGVILSSNPAAGEILGAGPLSPGRKLEEIVGPDTARHMLEPSAQIRGQVVPREIPLCRPDLETIPMGFTTTVLKEQELPRGRIIMFRNLMEKKRLEERMQRMDRLAALGEMAARVAHEIRNPLVSIGSLLELIRSELGAGHPTQKDFQTIFSEIERLDRIIQDYLAFARPQPSAPAPNDIAEIVRQTAALVSAQARSRGVTLRNHLRSPRTLHFDSQRLKQVLVNIFVNAMDAMPDGGAIQIKGRAQADCYRLVISDLGPGIPEEHMSHVFTPFFSTKSKGSGLGLSICQRIMEEHGGSVQLSNRRQGGLNVILTFPIHPRDRS